MHINNEEQKLILRKISFLETQRKPANVSKESIDYMCNAIKKLATPIILEIGTFNGYSALHFAAVSQSVTSIEKDPEIYKIAKENCKGIKNIRLINGNAMHEIPLLNARFNVCFIDAQKQEYLQYLKAFLTIAPKKFVVFADNTISHKEKMPDFFEFLKHSNLKWKELHIGRGLARIER